MNLYYKIRILVNGLVPLKDMNYDGYILKQRRYDPSSLDLYQEDNPFYVNKQLVHSCYKDKDSNVYFYILENEEQAEIEVSLHVTDERSLKRDLEKKLTKKIQLLEKKLRLLLGVGVSLPVYRAQVYHKGKLLCILIGEVSNKISPIINYTSLQQELLRNRLMVLLKDEPLLKLEAKNKKFQRALEFFNESFMPDKESARFTLLFSSMESLLSEKGKLTKASLIKNGCKLLYLDFKKEEEAGFKKEIGEYYHTYSNYILGEDASITEEMEFNLRERVRGMLLVYWFMASAFQIYDTKEMGIFLESPERDGLEEDMTRIIKSFYLTNYQMLHGKNNKD